MPNNLTQRGLFVLERRGVLPEEYSTDISSLPPLFPLIKSTGILAEPEEGYDDSDFLRGVLVAGTDREGQRLVLISMKGYEVSNDHRPFYELAFGAPAGSKELTYHGGQRFFYDLAGIEGMEWYFFWWMLALPGMWLAAIIFTVVVYVRKRRRAGSAPPAITEPAAG